MRYMPPSIVHNTEEGYLEYRGEIDRAYLVLTGMGFGVLGEEGEEDDFLIDEEGDDIEEDDGPLGACEVCREQTFEDELVICGECEKGFHLECLSPPLKEPSSNWSCPDCQPGQPHKKQRV